MNIKFLNMKNIYTWDSLVAQMVKHLPPMQETWVQSLGWEDPLEKEMATHSSSILAWRIPCREEPSGLQSMGMQRAHTTEGLSMHSCLYITHLDIRSFGMILLKLFQQ